MSDIYQTVTDRIVALIEGGEAGGWRCPWHSRAGAASMVRPVNVTGRAYRGINVPLLWATAEAFGYASPVWGTYKQWQERGAQVRKGEKSTLIIFWKKLSSVTQNDEGEEETSDRLMARGYAVFNAAQVDGYVAKPTSTIADLPQSERVANAEAFFAATGSTVRHGGNKAYYTTAGDHIQMPEFGQFRDGVSYYSTLGHEHVHWTGHKSRCNREFGKRFGDRAYAFEELVAELGAAFLCAELGLSNEPRADHAAYIGSWLGCLKADKRAIFTAASKAQAAVDHLLELQRGPPAEPQAVDNIIYLPAPAADPEPAKAPKTRTARVKGKAFSVTSLRGKGIYPLPVAVAEFAGGEKIRMTFWQERGRPWDIASARRLLAQTIGNERARARSAVASDLHRRIGLARALAEKPGTASEGEAARAAVDRLVKRQADRQAHADQPATDFRSFHIEHDGKRITAERLAA